MRIRTTSRISLITAGAAILALGTFPSAHAAIFTWNGGGADDNWTSGANWGGTAPTSASGADLIFSGDVRNSPVNNNAGVFTVGSGGVGLSSITFANDGTIGTNAFTLSGIVGSTLDIKAGGSGGGQSILTVASSVLIADVISANIGLTANLGISTGALHNLTISGAITNSSGTRNFGKTGTGELTLTNAGNTWAGTTSINAGTLTVDVAGGIANQGVASALGNQATAASAQINFNGATLNIKSGAASTDRQIRIGSTVITAPGGATITNNSANGSTPLVFSNAAFNVVVPGTTASRNLTLGGSNTDANAISGVIANNDTGAGGSVSVTKQDAGSWTLSGNNTYTGTTTVAGGMLIAANNKALGDTTQVTVNGGTLDVRGSTAGTLTLGTNAALLASSGTINFDLGTAFDQIVSTGTGTFSITGGTFALALGSGFDYGNTYNVLSGFGGVNSVAGLSFSGYDSVNYTAALSNAGVLSFVAVPEPTSMALLAASLTGMVLFRRRHRA